MYVVDTGDPSTLLKDGEVGEVCIGGVQVRASHDTTRQSIDASSASRLAWLLTADSAFSRTCAAP